ncbi:MAG: phage tail protein [Nostocaceae cyanobacterium]|nr:phage tail protein [Nostocaceae cyanobacterium]
MTQPNSNYIISSYIKYLPAILWSSETDPTQFLARMLCIFEQILTGITEDETAIKDYEPLEKTIDKLPEILNPWQTPAKFLPWLATWVALELRDDWSEYQQRKFISKIMSIYQQRGLKQGLLTYLDIYAATEAKPRIAIDDSEAIFRANLARDEISTLHAIAYSHTVSDIGVLLHPTALAIDRENNYIVADRGGQEDNKTWVPALWKVSTTGEIPYTGMSPQPIYSGNILKNPVAVVIDNQNQYSVLTEGEENTQYTPAIYRFISSNNNIASQPITVINNLPVAKPVDMVLDTSGRDGKKRLIVLDKGDPFDADKPTKIVIISEGNPTQVERQQVLNLGEGIELTAMTIDAQGRLIIANAQDRNTQEPADIIRIDPQNNWSITSLLATVEPSNNPLIYPTGLVLENPESLIVCDTGVRSGFQGNITNKSMAEPAAIYRLDLSQTTPTITKITDERKLINPSKIALDKNGQLIIAERGEANEKREWRSRNHEFGVIVLFSQQRETSVDIRNQIRFDIEKVINEQKPAHTSWSMNLA